MCAPGGAAAKPVGTFDFIVADPGDQTRPSIDGQYVIYSGPGAAGGLDVLLYNTLFRTKQIVAGADAGDPPGSYDEPDVSFSTAIYRGPRGIGIEFWQTSQPLRVPPAGGDGPVSAPTIGSAVAAWESGAGSRDIVLNRWGDFSDRKDHVIPAPDGGAPVGDQHSPSAYGDLVGYVDGADGEAVWLYDSAAGTFARVCDGIATAVSVGSDGSETFVAVARTVPPGDQDIEIWPTDGKFPPVLLRVPGVQRNPHLSGPWVAFEDVSTGRSQVVLWKWTTGPNGLMFVPHPSATDQVLNDLSLVVGEEVRVVFEDSASAETGRDIALYVLELAPLVDDGLPGGYPFEEPPPPAEPARCDGDAAPIATLHLRRSRGAPLADEVPFRFELPPGAAALPVLVCIDAKRVSSAWVTLDDEAVARPSDFDPSVVHLEVRSEVQGGAGKISGVIAGKPGAALDVRVLADPARLAQPSPAGRGGPAAAGAAIAGAASGGCASGPAGAGALLGLALLLARRRPRRG